MIRGWWPDLVHEPGGDWVLLRQYRLPDGWQPAAADLAFQIPQNLPGQQPYAFFVRGEVLFQGASPTSHSFPVPDGTVPFPGTWGQFSWAPEIWAPGHEPADGDNVLGFARSFARRFAEGA